MQFLKYFNTYKASNQSQGLQSIKRLSVHHKAFNPSQGFQSITRLSIHHNAFSPSQGFQSITRLHYITRFSIHHNAFNPSKFTYMNLIILDCLYKFEIIKYLQNRKIYIFSFFLSIFCHYCILILL